MFDREHAPDLPDLLICLLSRYQIMAGEDHGSKVPQPFPSNLHRGPETGIERSGDPCRTEIAPVVEVGEWFGRLEGEDFGKVPAYIEVEEGDDDGLPGSEMWFQKKGKSTKERRAIFIAAGSESVMAMDEYMQNT